MAGRLDRFLNLEQARTAAPDRASPQAQSLAEPPPELLAARQKQLESGLVVDERDESEQPFIRCGQCGTDSARAALRCPTCSNALDTPLQRAFNQALWRKRRAEMDQELEARRARLEKSPSGGGILELRAAPEIASAKSSLAQALAKMPLPKDPIERERAQRKLGELLARQVFEQETQRLDWMGDPRDESDSRPFGLRMLATIPSPGLRAMTALMIIGLGCTLLWQALFARHGRNPLLFLPLIAMAWLFVPRWRPDRSTDNFD